MLDCEWFNSECNCEMCYQYRTELIKINDTIEHQEADYSWDDTWEYIYNLKSTFDI